MTSTPMSPSFGVAAGHPLAADAGLDALRRGGSAVDAVLAAAFTQWVVNGPLCGPGGDLFVMYAPGDGDEVTVFGGWSATPLAFPVGGPVPSDGPTVAVVPGAVAGAAAASQAAGRLPWETLFASALRFADGHIATEWMAKSYRSVVEKGHGDALASFLDNAAAPSAGDVVSCSRLGKSLLRLAEAGPDDFYRGVLAETIVAAAREAGAHVGSDDLDRMSADVRPGVVHHFDDVTVVLPPPPSQAAIVAELMAAAGPGLAPESARYAEVVAPVVERELTARCVVGVPGTAASVATDGSAMAAVVHSLAGVQFGTGWVAADTGIAFGNRIGTSLTTRPDLPAANPVPGAPLPHTLSAALFRDATRSALVATPGGDRQVQWLAQAGQRFRRQKSLREIASGPRWFVCPEGDRFGVPGGIGSEWFLFPEDGVEWTGESALVGYTVRAAGSGGGGIQAVQRAGDTWSVESDPGAGGAARTGGARDV